MVTEQKKHHVGFGRIIVGIIVGLLLGLIGGYLAGYWYIMSGSDPTALTTEPLRESIAFWFGLGGAFMGAFVGPLVGGVLGGLMSRWKTPSTSKM